jgi:hypothetical protein
MKHVGPIKTYFNQNKGGSTGERGCVFRQWYLFDIQSHIAQMVVPNRFHFLSKWVLSLEMV